MRGNRIGTGMLLVLAVAVVLLLPACGGGDDAAAEENGVFEPAVPGYAYGKAVVRPR